MGIRVSNLIDCGLCVHLKDGICTCNSDIAREKFKLNNKTAANNCPEFLNERVPLSGVISNEHALRFILAGKCEFILKSGKTGTHIKFKLDKRVRESDSCDSENKDWFYWVNTAYIDEPMMYAGVVFFDFNDNQFKFVRGNRGMLNNSDKRVKSLIFVLNNLFNGKTDINVEVISFGKCGRCGKKLTDAESMRLGLSSQCLQVCDIPVKRENKDKNKDADKVIQPEELFESQIPSVPIVHSKDESINKTKIDLNELIENAHNKGINIEIIEEDTIEHVFDEPENKSVTAEKMKYSGSENNVPYSQRQTRGSEDTTWY